MLRERNDQNKPQATFALAHSLFGVSPIASHAIKSVFIKGYQQIYSYLTEV